MAPLRADGVVAGHGTRSPLEVRQCQQVAQVRLGAVWCGLLDRLAVRDPVRLRAAVEEDRVRMRPRLVSRRGRVCHAHRIVARHVGVQTRQHAPRDALHGILAPPHRTLCIEPEPHHKALELLPDRQRATERREVEPVPLCPLCTLAPHALIQLPIRKQLKCGVDLVTAGEEGKDVAARLGEVDVPDGIDGLLQVVLARLVEIRHVHRKRSSLDLKHRRSVLFVLVIGLRDDAAVLEKVFKSERIDGGTRHDDSQLGPFAEDLGEYAEQQIESRCAAMGRDEDEEVVADVRSAGSASESRSSELPGRAEPGFQKVGGAVMAANSCGARRYADRSEPLLQRRSGWWKARRKEG
ncbi:hypothetical protein L1887_56244 [Cichorium endivia]|nr:hypothetical protein L1887_56244 [Cichorium endivia]